MNSNRVWPPANSGIVPPTTVPTGPKYPADAWTFIGIFFAISLLGARVGLGPLLNYLFPLGALAVGLHLFARHPNLYIGFTWWLWFVTPFIRRIADYWGNYTEPSPMLLAPFLVTGLTILSAIKELPNANIKGALPFAMASMGVLYGFWVGIINYSEYSSNAGFTLVKALLGWLSPVTFGWYMFSRWRDYPQCRQITRQVFLWGILVMGLYGIWQFVALPEWDRMWLLKSGLFSSHGLPDEAGGSRVWSTMHSAEPFSAYAVGGLLFLFSHRGPMLVPASVAGLVALLLTTVRSAWLGFFAGFFALFGFLKPSFQVRLICLVTLIMLCAIPILTSDIFSDDILTDIVGRLNTFSNLEDDRSTDVRLNTFNALIGKALVSFVGRGLGRGVQDSTILSTMFEIGWIGVLFYVGGMLLLLIQLFGTSCKADSFAVTTRAIIVSALIRIPVNSVFEGVTGILLWASIGLGLAAIKYNTTVSLKAQQPIGQNISPPIADAAT